MSDSANTGRADDARAPGPLDRLLRPFGDVRAGEGATVLLMCFNIFLLLLAYHVLKTVREPLILLAGGAELKSYAAAFQAVTLIAYVPLYGWVAQKLPRQRFLAAVILFFVGCIQLIFLGSRMGVPHLGFVFFVWVGIFSLTTIAQFWSYANEICTRPEGNRLFPLIAIGSTAGAPAENSTDYSVMNTAKQMLWLPTSREEKYKAKQAIDTFFVRAGDMLAAGVVFVGTHLVHSAVVGFARINIVFVLLAMVVAWLLLREYRRITSPSEPSPLPEKVS